MVYAAEDSAVLFQDFGVPVQLAGAPAVVGVLLDSTTVEQGVGFGLALNSAVLVTAHGALGEPEHDSEITIDGERFLYRGLAPIDNHRYQHHLVARSVDP